MVTEADGYSRRTIEPVPAVGGEQIVLCDSFVRAGRYRIGPGNQTALMRDDRRLCSLRIFSGSGSMLVADPSELDKAAPRLQFEPGDLFLIPPGIYYSLRNESGDCLLYSEHVIAPDVAFI